MSELSQSTSPRARLFTAFGTVLYVDRATGELKHGPIEASPANAYFQPRDGSASGYRRGQLVHAAGGSDEPIYCFYDVCLTASQSQGKDRSDSGAATLELVPLERGLLALGSDGRFLSAIPDGRVMHRASVCSTWELFIASENWCTDSPEPALNGAWRRDEAAFNRRHIASHIVHPLNRMKSARQPRAKKILIYGYTKWSHGRVYYDLCRHLHDRGYLVDILDWQQNHAEYAHQLISYYDFVIAALDGVSTLADSYHVPFDKIIAISHHEFDIRMLVEQKGIEVFEKFANYGVVSEYVYCASLMRGVPRVPMVASLGVNFDEFYSDVSDKLAAVGYASSMSVKTYGVEWKRGELAQAAVADAGLTFRIAGSTGNQTSFLDMPEFYRSVDAVVTSSVSEAAQLPVMEAAAAGRLVIGTPVGHFPRKAYQGAGIMAPIEAGKFKAFTTETLRFYKDNPGLYTEKCKSIQNAARNFDWVHSIDEWVTLIDSSDRSVPPVRRVEKPVKTLRKGIICDINWLKSYLADEHYHCIKILNEVHGFDIIDSKNTNFSDEDVINSIGMYSVIIVAYQGYVSVPIDKINTYTIVRVDDLVSYDPKYDEYLNHLIAHADMIISPYAYEFSNHYKHRLVVWVPYSSALEGCKDYERVTFNKNPINKILLTGSVAWDRPFRKFVSELNDPRIDKLEHPGYHKKYDERSQETVKTKYYVKLSDYLCCFSDSHLYRYIHLKNFEIASSGSLLLADKETEKEMNELGFIDNETCIFTKKDDFYEKMEWILSPDNRATVDRIRLAGMDLVRNKHMTKHRAEQIDLLVNSIISALSVGDFTRSPELAGSTSASG
ncbi:glycosyltransferase [Mesorhizobium sp.]|uniref:glycosyltransferase n=1 Tax=Mesorhizobium sp. TaxID=1871066 RepID=UPI0025D9C161|nr:glycosyltransferase [Mesorhizobium sp.]